MAKILDGRIVRDIIKRELSQKIASFKVPPTLVIIQVGEKEESNIYIKQKKIFGESVGAKVIHIEYPETVAEAVLIGEIKKLNEDKNIHGIILQLPLPKKLHPEKIIENINPQKDVDGMTGFNLKLLMEGKNSGVMPATTRGIITLLDYYKVPIDGKTVVIVGRSALVGKPTALALLNRNATVIICHTYTKDLAGETCGADILVVAIGNPEMIDEKFVGEGQVVIDVGISRVESVSGKIEVMGDVNLKDVEGKVEAISPVPGGVGPMTVVSLFQNLLDAYNMQTK